MADVDSKSLAQRIVDRVMDPNKLEHFREQTHTPNQDIIRDYMRNKGGTFEQAMKWAVKQDAMNDPKGSFAKGLSNAWNKEINKRALEKAGIKRVN